MPRSTRFAVVVLVPLLVSIGLSTAAASDSATLETIEPPQVPAGKGASVTVKGSGFISCGVTTLKLFLDRDHQYEFTDLTLVSDTELVAVIMPAPAAEEYQVRLLDAAGTNVTRNSPVKLFLETVVRPPIVRSVSPVSVPDTGGTITIAGNRLGTASQAVLESGSEMLPLSIVSKNSISVTATVPAGAIPGSYRLRVVTEGGANIKAPTFTVSDSLAGRPKPASMSPDTVTAGQATVVTVRGRNLDTVTSIELSRPGAGTTTLAASSAVYGSFQFTVPAALGAGLYSARLNSTIAGGPYEARRLQLGVALPGNPPGCPDVVQFDPLTYEIATPALKLRMSSGILAYVRDLRVEGAMVARNPAEFVPTGIRFDSTGIPDAFLLVSLSHAGTLFEGGGSGCRVVQRFTNAASGASFEVVVERTGNNLRVRLPYSSPAQNVFATYSGIFGIDPDSEMIIPASNGSRVTRNGVLDGQFIHPVWEQINRFLYSSQNGGWLAFDYSATQDVLSSVYGFGRSTTGLWLNTYTRSRKSALRNDTHVDLTIEAVASSFDLAMEAARLSLVNPAPPEAKRPFSLVVIDALELQGLGGASARIQQEIERFETEEWGLPIPLEDRLAIYVGYTVNVNNTSYPDFDQPIDAALFGPDIAGRRLPFFNAYGLHPVSPLAGSLMNVLLTFFDRDAAVEKPFIWDPDSSGALDGPYDHYFVSLAAPEWRQVLAGQFASLQAQIGAAAPGVGLDGIYLDAASSLTMEDRNTETGVNLAGFRTFIDGLRASSSDPSRFIAAAEAFNVPLCRTGVSQQTRGMIFLSGEDFVLYPALNLGARPHAVAAYVMGKEGRGFHHYAGGEVTSASLVHYPVRFIGYLTGVTPTFLHQGNPQASSTQTSVTGKRGIATLLEEGLFWSRHSVEPWYEPHPAWGDPATGTILSVDGAPRVFTRDELRDKVILDAWYHFAGTVPTPSQMTKCRNLTSPNVVGILAYTSILRDVFSRNPTPPGTHLSRPEAVSLIRSTLGIDYPLP